MRFKEVHKDKFSILKRAQEIQDKEGKRIDLIKTVISKLNINTTPYYLNYMLYFVLRDIISFMYVVIFR